MVRTVPVRALPLMLGIGACSLMAQSSRFEPGEVRASSAIYTPRSQYTLRTETKLVEVGVVVRDRTGRTVDGLTKADFEIRE